MDHYYYVRNEDSSSDEEINEILVQRRRIINRRPYTVRIRPDHFNIWDSVDFVGRFRLSRKSVACLHSKIEREISHKTQRNHAVPAILQILIALRFYATGCVQIVAGDFGGVHRTTAGKIIRKVTTAIAKLKPHYVKFPRNESGWNELRREFYKIARFPRVVGAIDCTHVRMESPDDVFAPNSWSSIIQLNHPRYERPSKYLLKKASNMIYELQTFKESNRSWLIGEAVKSDGSIFITTPIDPVFLILPHLISHCASRAVPLDQLLASSEKDDLKELADLKINLKCVADLKGPEDLCAYKYNEEKTLRWLEAKVKKLVDVVKSEKLHVKSGAVSATFVASSLKEEQDDEELYLKYSYGIVNEYLPEDLSKKLYDRFNFKVEIIPTIGGSNKRKSDAKDCSVMNKKVKTDGCDEVSEEKLEDTKENIKTTSEFFSDSNLKKNAKPVVLTSKEKQRQKAASGSKNIMSFFTKKNIVSAIGLD